MREARSRTLLDSSLGRAQVKVKRLPGEAAQIAPEYESCRTLAEPRRLPIAEVYRVVQREALARLAGHLAER